jgi:hypothetical protein
VYRLHYPHAKTHLSPPVHLTLPDGTSVFKKTRSKKRCPFSKEEDEVLRRGYKQVSSLSPPPTPFLLQYSTVWATNVKDLVFQSRCSTDLRNCFRNAFPDHYQQASYKPRTLGMYTDETSPPASVAPKVRVDTMAAAFNPYLSPTGGT